MNIVTLNIGSGHFQMRTLFYYAHSDTLLISLFPDILQSTIIPLQNSHNTSVATKTTHNSLIPVCVCVAPVEVHRFPFSPFRPMTKLTLPKQAWPPFQSN